MPQLSAIPFPVDTTPADNDTPNGSDQDWAAADQLSLNASQPSAMIPDPSAQVQPIPTNTPQYTAPEYLPVKEAPLTITNPQYQRGTLNRIDQSGNSQVDAAVVQAQGDTDASKIKADQVSQDAKFNDDFAKAHDSAMAQMAIKDQQVQSAYDDYKKSAASSGEDPKNHYFGDHGGIAGRIVSGLAAFASGMSQGLIKQGGNPYLDYLNKEIDHNFQAHKKHVDDMFQEQVQAGKIADNASSRAEFDQKAKLIHKDLADKYVNDQLSQIAATTNSGIAKSLIQKTQADVAQQQLDQREIYSQNLAKSQAAASAAAFAREKEVRATYQGNIDKLVASGLTPDEASTEAFRLTAPQYNRSDVSHIANELGVPYDAKAGSWTIPDKTPKNDDDLIPKVDANGKKLKPEDIEKLNQLKAVKLDGTIGLANSVEDQKHVTQEISAQKKVQDFYTLLKDQVAPDGKVIPGLITKWKTGAILPQEVGQWQAARKFAIESVKAASSGSEGVTQKGAADLLGEGSFPESPNEYIAAARSALGATVNKYGNLNPNIAAQKMEGQTDALGKFLQDNEKSIAGRFRQPKGSKQVVEEKPKEAPLTKAISKIKWDK